MRGLLSDYVDEFLLANGARFHISLEGAAKAKKTAAAAHLQRISRVKVALYCMAHLWDLDEQRIRETCAELESTEDALVEGQDRVFLCSPDNVENAVLLAFLFGKGVKVDMEANKRVSQFRKVLDKNYDCYKLVAERLYRLVLEGERGMHFEEPHPSAFKCFQELHTEWNDGCSFVTFRDHRLLRGKPHVVVERRQMTGLCFAHAPIVLQHYLVAMHRTDPVPMLDLSEYLRRREDRSVLEGRIFHDRGGNAKKFLESIILPGSSLRECPLTEPTINELPQHLELFGPALVSGFEVDDSFLDSQRWYYTGSHIDERTAGLHAMVLIGYRKAENQFCYLLQNWWIRKPYVEVSQEYLMASKSRVFFVTTPQTEIPFPFTTSLDLVEWELRDAAELE